MNTPLEALERLKEHASRSDWQTARVLSDDLRSLLTSYEAQGERLREVEGENRNLKAVPWPREYVMSRAADWKRLLRETRGYIQTCRGKCGSDISGREYAIKALADASAELEAALTQPPAMENGE